MKPCNSLVCLLVLLTAITNLGLYEDHSGWNPILESSRKNGRLLSDEKIPIVREVWLEGWSRIWLRVLPRLVQLSSIIDTTIDRVKVQNTEKKSVCESVRKLEHILFRLLNHLSSSCRSVRLQHILREQSGPY